MQQISCQCEACQLHTSLNVKHILFLQVMPMQNVPLYFLLEFECFRDTVPVNIIGLQIQNDPVSRTELSLSQD